MNLNDWLALRYHERTERFDRGMPGVWHPHDREVWMPRPDFMRDSNDHAESVRRELRALSNDPAGFSHAIRYWARYPYSRVMELLRDAPDIGMSRSPEFIAPEARTSPVATPPHEDPSGHPEPSHTVPHPESPGEASSPSGATRGQPPSR